MKAIMSLISRDESGKILIMALVLLVVGVLLLTPLLGLMSTGLFAGQVYERKTAELYAADAGIEEALWYIRYREQVPTQLDLEVNERLVEVTIHSTSAQAFLTEMLGIDEKNWPHSGWVILSRVTEDGQIEISIAWEGSGSMRLEDVGVWLSGTYSYVQGQDIADGDIRHESPPDDLEPEPWFYQGGTVFFWTWKDAKQQDKPDFDKDTPARFLRFDVSPTDRPASTIGFTMAVRQNVGLSTDADFAIYLITATATSEAHGHTAIVARATHGCDRADLSVLNWTIATGDAD